MNLWLNAKKRISGQDLDTEHVAGPRGADHEVGDGGGHDRLGVAEGVDAALEGQITVTNKIKDCLLHFKQDLVRDVLPEAASAGVGQDGHLDDAAGGRLPAPRALVQRVRHDAQRVGRQALPVPVARDHRDVVQRERLQPRHVERRRVAAHPT